MEDKQILKDLAYVYGTEKFQKNVTAGILTDILLRFYTKCFIV